MILEKADVAVLRLTQASGRFPSETHLAQAELTAEQFETRLHRLRAANVVAAFHVTLAVPPLLGGDWVFGAVLAYAQDPLRAANLLTKKLPFVTETIFNSGLPDGLGPNLSLLFYSRDFDSSVRFIQGAPGLEYQEVYRLGDYSFPMALPLSNDERLLIRLLVNNPDSDITAVGAALGQSPTWVRTKLDRLLGNELNRSGVLRIQPDVNWSEVSNFGHFHFLIETGHRPEQLARLLQSDAADRPESFQLVLGGKLFRNRYVQVEADVWGIGDLMDRVMLLNQLAGIRVAGVLWNRAVRVNTSWVRGLVSG